MELPKKISEINELEKVFDILGQSTDSFRNDRDRPYNGQPWTDLGERGKTEVKSLTMRDIHDCFIMGFLDSLPGGHEKVEDNTWCVNDLYMALKNTHFDPMAVSQNMNCHIEKMMEIFPNVSKFNAENPFENIPIIQLEPV